VADHSEAKGRKFGFAAAPAALVLALLAALGQDDSAHEGRKFIPYRDSGGIWTVCAGITGSAVIPGKRYTPDECTRLEAEYVQAMLRNMGHCVRGEFQFHEVKAWGHFAYNVGTGAFCSSTAAKRLNAGEREAVCSEIWRFRYVRIGGVKRDCALPEWKEKCGGIIPRRQWEMATCRGQLQ